MAIAWTAVKNSPPFPVSTMLLLTDGSIFCQAINTNQWWRLRPDSSGSYSSGSWAQAAPAPNAPLYYASATLGDGTIFVAGGEDNQGRENVDLCTAEIYDPLADRWTTIDTPTGWKKMGDAPCCVLPDGKVLLGSIEDDKCALYDPKEKTWSVAGRKSNQNSNEETWTLLPDGSVLSVDCNGHPATERYVKGNWQPAGDIPLASIGGKSVDLVEDSSIEVGPAILLYNGSVFAVGATGATAIYMPGPNPSVSGQWQSGLPLPTDINGRQLGAKDAPAALLPDGRVIFVAGPVDGQANTYDGPCTFFEYATGQLTSIPTPPSLLPSPGSATSPTAPFELRMLLLPSSEVLLSDGTPNLLISTAIAPAAQIVQNAAPIITSCPKSLSPRASYVLQGVRLNGVSQACSYGDDAAMATNYPLVRLISHSSTTVHYCRTFNHSTMGISKDGTTQSTEFVVPADITVGSYLLSVVANGIASAPYEVNVGARTRAESPPVPATQDATPKGISPRVQSVSLGFIVLVVAASWNIWMAPQFPLAAWIVTLFLTAFSIGLIGRLGGRWASVFIDNRNVMSLSKLQVLAWTAVIFSALLTASAFNAGVKSATAQIPSNQSGSTSSSSPAAASASVPLAAPMASLSATGAPAATAAAPAATAAAPAAAPAPSTPPPAVPTGSQPFQTVVGIVIDPKIWLLLGISLTAGIATPLVLVPKLDNAAAEDEVAATAAKLCADTGLPPQAITNQGHVLQKTSPAYARWSDLILGDEVGNGAVIDFSKVQQIYFTFLTIFVYSLALATLFSSGVHNPITQLPAPNDGFVTLLAVSHAGSLLYKSTPHSTDATTSGQK